MRRPALRSGDVPHLADAAAAWACGRREVVRFSLRVVVCEHGVPALELAALVEIGGRSHRLTERFHCDAEDSEESAAWVRRSLRRALEDLKQRVRSGPV